MSVLTAGRNPTLLDLAKAEDPMGQIAQVAEILNEVNEVLDDWTFMEGNLTTGTMVSYAEKRTRNHLSNFTGLYCQLVENRIEEPWLEHLESHNNIFSEIDYKVYR